MLEVSSRYIICLIVLPVNLRIQSCTNHSEAEIAQSRLPNPRYYLAGVNSNMRALSWLCRVIGNLPGFF